MNTKGIVAIAILGILLVTTLYVTPAPVVNSATDTLFDVTLLAASDTNPNRRQWTQIVANSFRSVGINAQVQYLLWDICYDRCITPPPEIARKTFNQGGYDIFFVGTTPGNPAAPYLGTYQYYFSSMIPPGSNMYWYNSSDFDHWMQVAMVKGYTVEGSTAYKNAQSFLFNDQPNPMILFMTAVFAASNSVNFHGSEWLFDNIGPVPQYCSGVTSLTLASPSASYQDLLQPLSNSWYDTLVYYPLYNGLFDYGPDLSILPSLAESYEVSTNGSVYTYHLRHGVTWHDGEPFTADDVVFTFFAYLDPDNLNQFTTIYTGFIGDEVAFTYLNGTTSRLVVEASGDTLVAHYPALDNQTAVRKGSVTALDTYTVQVTIADFGDLGAPAGIFHVDGEPTVILPKHILDHVPLTEWKQCVLNTATGSQTINGKTYTGPVGTGPYTWGGFSAATGLATMNKNPNYWNKTGLESLGEYTITQYNVLMITNKDAAIANLKNNVVQAIDQNFQLQNDATAGNLAFASVYYLPGSGQQGFAINLNHPVFGTGVATPLGQSNPSRAAYAAQCVRQAMDYLIPKQLIIDSLLAGYAIPASVPVNPISPYFNQSCAARPYDPTMAKSLLAAAGYDTGVSPPGPDVVSATYLVNEPIIVTGAFNVDPVISAQQGGWVVRLWVSYTSGTTGFSPVATTYSTSGGYYELQYSPTQNGTLWLQVEMTGVGIKKAQEIFYNGPDYNLVPIVKQATPQLTAVTNVTVTTFDAINAPQQTQINNLNSQINSLNAALANANMYAYVGIGIGIVALLVAIFALLRKK
jgi:ABC-type transport system substrate-binding protein